MKSLLISTITVLLGSTLFCGSANAASILVLVANGSDITINLPAEYSHNKLVNVISHSGNNNPLLFDWIGGNGANKAPQLTIGEKEEYKEPQHSILGGNPGSYNATSDIATALYNALLQKELSTVDDDRYEEYSDDGESKVVSSTEGVSAIRAPSMSSLTSSSGPTKRMMNTSYGKYVTEAMKESD